MVIVFVIFIRINISLTYSDQIMLKATHLTYNTSGFVVFIENRCKTPID